MRASITFYTSEDYNIENYEARLDRCNIDITADSDVIVNAILYKLRDLVHKTPDGYYVLVSILTDRETSVKLEEDIKKNKNLYKLLTENYKVRASITL